MSEERDPARGVWAFFILTYIVTLLTWGAMVAFRIPGASAGSASSPASPVGLLLLFLGGFAPSLAGILLTWRFTGGAGLRTLWSSAAQTRIGWKWYLAIFALPFIALLARVAVQVARQGTVLEPAQLTRPASLIAFTITIILGGALAEEIGWRGFALGRLLHRWSAGAASLILGVFWLLWHLPLFFIAGTVQASHGNFAAEFGVFAIWILALAVLFTWIYIGSGRSLFAALLFHTAVDWFGTLAGSAVSNGGIVDRLVNSLAFAVIALVVLLAWRQRGGSHEVR